MISISHSQAQRLIRRALDRPAPEAEWTALQAHLESCAECRAYRERRVALEKNLRRGLRARWLAYSEPAPGLADALNARRQARTARRSALGYAGLALALAMLLIGLYNGRSADAGQPQSLAHLPPEPTAAPTATPTPTAAPGSGFQGVLAFDARPGKNADIFLLESGPGGSQLTNLTAHPARDFEPAWSPDGAWIAFLSNRDRTEGSGAASGADIYVISVAGTRLTRLTADPSLAWSGPLAWSPDGRWIAATGSRRSPGSDGALESERWIYRVSLDGAPPRALPYSRGGSQPRFSPGLPLLGYLAEEQQLSFLRIYDARSGRTHDVARGESAQMAASGQGATAVINFDWAPDGYSILYTALRSVPERDPNQVHLRMVDISRRVEGLPETINTTRRSSRVLGIFPAFAPVVSASLSPDSELLYARSYWRGGRGPACRPLESAPRAGLPDLGLPVLCIESPIERSAWSADGRWLALAAHTTTEDDPGIYVFQVPASGQRVLKTERLHDLPAASGALRVRPDGPNSVIRPIDPRPARHVVLDLPAVPPGVLLSRALLTRPGSSGANLARLRPDGAGAAPLRSGLGGSCPSAAPDGGAVVFTGADPGSDLKRSDIYVIDGAGREARRLTRLMPPIPPYAGGEREHPMAGQYGCPSWSPDGTQLAAWIDSGGRSYLALIPAEGAQTGSQVRYLPLAAPDPRPRPIWSADGRRLLLFLHPAGESQPNLSSLNVATGLVTRLADAAGWSGASQAALSPDGKRLAYTTLQYAPSGEIQASLRVTTLKTRRTDAPFRLPSYDPLETVAGSSSRSYSSREYGSLAWLSDTRLGLAYHGSPDGSVPPALLLYDLEGHSLVTLAELEEDLLSAAWSPDGRWALYSTSSGLWSLSVRGALARSSAPIWLAGEVAQEINWH